MSLRVECQKCGSSHSVNQRMLGRSIRCPVCDANIAVPADLPESQTADAEPEGFVEGEIVSADEELATVETVPSELVSGGSLVVGYESSQFDSHLGVESEKRRVELENDEEFGDVLFAKRELPKDDMDMTPMVDVTFLLLIFFMITASFSSEKVIEEPPPPSDKASTNAREEPEKILDTVRVQVDEFNAYTIILPGGEDRQASSKQDLLIALGDARRELVTGANDDALKLAVEAHTESIHAAVVAAIDAGREKGFSSIQVTVVEEFD